MNDTLFDWDDANILHVTEHEVTLEEAEEVILGNPLDIELEVVDGEERSSHLGETSEGRILWVVITFRAERMRVVTAFEPDKKWKVFYLEQRVRLQ
ncbi:MAG: BrnT family toxin [Terracidiphilus sp.]